jgi:hypothetical protein
MNETTVLQIPMAKSLRRRAELTAFEMGFSSLQEAARVIFTQLADKAMSIVFEPGIVRLSEKNDRRYAKMVSDIETGKVKLKKFSDVDKLMEYLNS